MILSKTTVPDIINANIFSTSLLKDNSSLCGPFKNLVTEYNSALEFNKSKFSPTPLTAFTDWARGFVLNGPKFETEFILNSVERFGTLPDVFKTIIIKDIDDHISAAKGLGLKDDVDYNTDFIKDLVNNGVGLSNRLNNTSSSNSLPTCGNSPCNYFHAITMLGDVIGTLAQPTATPTYNSSVPFKEIGEQMPIMGSLDTINKTPPEMAKREIQLRERLQRQREENLSPFFNNARKSRLQPLVEGAAVDYKASGDIMDVDYMHIHDTNKATSKILDTIHEVLNDCFRIYEFRRRYNPFNSQFNLAQAGKNAFDIVINEITYTIDFFGKVLKPNHTPSNNRLNNNQQSSTKE
jgi:hypothetical protein